MQSFSIVMEIKVGKEIWKEKSTTKCFDSFIHLLASLVFLTVNNSGNIDLRLISSTVFFTIRKKNIGG